MNLCEWDPDQIPPWQAYDHLDVLEKDPIRMENKQDRILGSVKCRQQTRADRLWPLRSLLQGHFGLVNEEKWVGGR